MRHLGNVREARRPPGQSDKFVWKSHGEERVQKELTRHRHIWGGGTLVWQLFKKHKNLTPFEKLNAVSKIEMSFPQRPHSVESIPYLDSTGLWWESQLYQLTAMWAASSFFTLNFTSIKQASVTLISQDSKNWDGVYVPLGHCLAHRGM